MNKQISLSFLHYELKEVKTHKREFLEQIDRIMPWGEPEELVRPCYYEGKRGNKPHDLELMLRIHLLQNLYTLSDEGTRNEVVDSRAFSDFCGVESSNQIPDAHSTKKGNTWHFGYKAHIGVDKDSGIVHSVEVTSANIHDVEVTPKLLTGEEDTVNGDSGYIGAEKREDAIVKNKQGKKIKYQIKRRPSQYKNKSNRSKGQIERREYEKSSVRAKVEHVFAFIKGQFGYRKTRYRGLRKQTAKLNMLFALANLILADRPSRLAA